MLVVLLLCSVASGDDRPAQASPPPAVDFARRVAPILESHCVGCHGATKRKGGLRLDRKADALAGGDSGPVIVPGKGGESLLIDLVSGADPDQVMPPKERNDRLGPGEVALLRTWIDQGAAWPEDDRAKAEVRSDHWAFRPVRRPEPPKVRSGGRVRNPIDAFVLARLEADGIAPSPEADRATLLRRLYLDLTGLLPSPAEADAFLGDRSPEAYERLVDHLLASPHFGERWGRHWLDLARYADSNGYERDDVRPNAWRYRDWVIRAINDDLPFDQFVVEQLAGDLLPGATEGQKTATGFHRMTLTNTESGINKDDYRNREVVDRVNTTGSALLGLTVGCAQCHSHKYDPISLTEYYQLYAFFENAIEVELPCSVAPEERAAREAALSSHKARSAALNERLALLGAIAKAGGVDGWRKGVVEQIRRDAPRLSALERAKVAGTEGWKGPLTGDESSALGLPNDVRSALGVEAERRDDAQREAVRAFVDSLDARIAEQRKQLRTPRDRLADLDVPSALVEAILSESARRAPAQSALVAEFEGSLAARRDEVGQQVRRLAVEERFLGAPAVMALVESTKDRRTTHVRLRGDFKQKGVEVAPMTPAVLPPLGARGGTPNRLDLARWIVSNENPLTARVAVNHAWAHLLGRGLVATVDNFGAQGERPSHPELLDWLAAGFRDGGWRRKALIRTIVTSTTYRQASRSRPDLESRDPLNTLLARQARFRVEGEVVRDLFLAASGLFYPAVGGMTIRPEAPASIRDIGYKYKLVWEVSPRPDRYRRGMYVHFMRSNPYPSLVMFDCPESTVCLPARNRSNTPLQALALLNDPVFVECARALGRRAVAEGTGDVASRLRFLGRVCLSRDLRGDEVEALRELFEAERVAYADDPAATTALLGEDRLPPGASSPVVAAWTSVARGLLNLDEFLTRE